jgi:hypothetical protein
VRTIARNAALVLLGLVLSPLTGLGQPLAARAADDPVACINALRGDRTESLRISALQTANYNRTTIGSALARAQAAIDKARKDEGDALYKAYQYAYRGAKTTANAWIKKANAATARANAAIKTYNAQIAIINKASSTIDAAKNAFSSRRSATDLTCYTF